jgi:hypothetical protein
MTTTLIPQDEQALEELDYRESDGIEVLLLWSRADGSLVVAVRDGRTAERFELLVGPEQALDAFQHPFAYAASSSLVPEGGAGAHAVDEAVAELEQQTLSYL